MPPRKSNGGVDTSLVSNGPAPQSTEPTDTTTTAPTKSSRNSTNSLAVEDLSLPRSMIQRLAKGVLPANTQVQKDALLALCKSATVFVSYLANSANDRAVLANKKTVRPEDVLEALAELEFEGFVGRCERELSKYNTIQCTKRNDYRRRVKEETKGVDGSVTNASDADALDTSVTASMLANMANGGEASGDVSMTNGHSRDYDGEPVAKKMRTGVNGANGHPREDGDETDVEDIDGEEEVEDEVEEEDEVQDEEEENGEEVEEDGDRLEYEGRRALEEDEESADDSD